MNVKLITPSISNLNNGNRVTALRYARLLRRLRHKVSVQEQYCGETCDVLIALHARKSSDSILRFRERYPDSPLVVVLTGTDLYRDLKKNPRAWHSLEAASRLVVLQRMGLDEIPRHLRARARVIYQSAECSSGPARPPSRYFKVCVAGHLRPEKDPLRAALAVRRLPVQSRVRIVHIGSALDEKLERQALRENEVNPRYRWLGGLPRWKTMRHIASSHLVAITSRIEGSSNVLSESLACGVPVIASSIPGLIGTLGLDYPGYFRMGDTAELGEQISRAENDLGFYETLRLKCRKAAALVSPGREIEAWQQLLNEVQSNERTSIPMYSNTPDHSFELCQGAGS